MPRRGASARLFRMGSVEAEQFDIRFWRRMSVSDRFAMTWQLSLEAYRLAGKIDEDEPRLRRSVVRLRRLRNKRALGRKKDLADVEELERGKRRVGKRARGTRRKRGT